MVRRFVESDRYATHCRPATVCNPLRIRSWCVPWAGFPSEGLNAYDAADLRKRHVAPDYPCVACQRAALGSEGE
jgi:hypothetical protein